MKKDRELERLYSYYRRFMKALNPQVNPNNPEEIKINERYFTESNDRDLFYFIERYVYEDEFTKVKKNDLVNFELRLSEMQIIETALTTLENEAVKTFNKEKFYDLEDILQKSNRFKDLHQLKKIFHALIEIKKKELQNEKK